ncbi:hypothetical protein SEUCBS139899_004304 [Sporothrix eucalyptigena]|uniref:Uncharacterized protein n=1 Tax=Sporothrix eucalyptigena TaxID=1812306 RepID=A0ABP0BSP2_9PEZI
MDLLDPEHEDLPVYEPPPRRHSDSEDEEEEELPRYEPPAEPASAPPPEKGKAKAPEQGDASASASSPYRVQTSMLLDAEATGPRKASPSSSTPAYRVTTSMLLDAGPGPSSGPVSVPTSIPRTFVADRADILPPTVLILNNQSVYAESVPATILYEADLGLAGLTPATKHVELQRLDHRTLADGTTRVRSRNFYALCRISHYLPSLTKMGLPEMFIYNRSSRTAPLGDFGWREASKDHWEALPARIGRHEFHWVEGGRALFKARYKNGMCTWTDKNGAEVAKMFETAEAGATTTPRLVVTVPMQRDQRDVLVALWCCYVWEQAVNRYVPVPVPRGKNPYKLSRVFN